MTLDRPVISYFREKSNQAIDSTVLENQRSKDSQKYTTKLIFFLIFLFLAVQQIKLVREISYVNVSVHIVQQHKRANNDKSNTNI